ncbi:MAG: hypothetical protein KJZ69_16320 [Phycisphaerales bacterium]|nr:hypothetical protein [Phycisphaerales bacterium]
MKEISFFGDLLDLFGLFIPGAVAMLLLYPLVMRSSRAFTRRRHWRAVYQSKFLFPTLLIIGAICIGVLVRGPSGVIQKLLRQTYPEEPLYAPAWESVLRHFNDGPVIPDDDDTKYTMILAVADETSVAPDNERFNRLLLLTRNMFTVLWMTAPIYLVWGLVDAKNRRKSSARRRRGLIKGLVAVLGPAVILLAAGWAFYFNYTDLQRRSLKAVCAQCLLGLNPPPTVADHRPPAADSESEPSDEVPLDR